MRNKRWSEIIVEIEGKMSNLRNNELLELVEEINGKEKYRGLSEKVDEVKEKADKISREIKDFIAVFIKEKI